MDGFIIKYTVDGKTETMQFSDSMKACERAKTLAVSLKENIDVYKIDLTTGKVVAVYTAYANGRGMVKNFCSGLGLLE